MTVRAVMAFGIVTVLAATRPATAQQAHTPPQMLHPAAGKTDCLSCHGAGANAHITSVPASHHFANGACGMCHKPATATPPAIKHAVDDAHANCRQCHVQPAAGATTSVAAPSGTPPAPAPPASHQTFDVSVCRLCHEASAAAPAGPGSD
jgi:hypothetical protein